MNNQLRLFDLEGGGEGKTYRAIRHDIVRKSQKENKNEVHHPHQKKNQIGKILKNRSGLKILEMFSGRGNLTREYEEHGEVEKYDQRWLKTGDSFLKFHQLIANKGNYDVVDIDPYGFPSRLLPDIFLLVRNGYIFMTFPKPFVNILNGITQAHLVAYYGEPNPSLEKIQERIVLYGLCHWREVVFENILDMGRLWRFALSVKKVKATDYTGVRNR